MWQLFMNVTIVCAAVFMVRRAYVTILRFIEISKLVEADSSLEEGQGQ